MKAAKRGPPPTTPHAPPGPTRAADSPVPPRPAPPPGPAGQRGVAARSAGCRPRPCWKLPFKPLKRLEVARRTPTNSLAPLPPPHAAAAGPLPPVPRARIRPHRRPTTPVRPRAGDAHGGEEGASGISSIYCSSRGAAAPLVGRPGGRAHGGGGGYVGGVRRRDRARGGQHPLGEVRARPPFPCSVIRLFKFRGIFSSYPSVRGGCPGVLLALSSSVRSTRVG